MTYCARRHKAGKSMIQALMWSPDGKHFVSGYWFKTVRIWDAYTGNTISTYRSYYEVVEAVAWSPDGKYIASGNRNGTAHVWNVTSGKKVRNFLGHCVKQANLYVVSSASPPDRSRIASP